MVNYIQYIAGSNKGETAQGDVLNSPFGIGKVDANYTSDKVVETVTTTGDFTPAWTPVLEKFFTDENGDKHDLKVTSAAGVVSYVDLTDGKYSATEGDKIAYVYNNVVIPQNDLPIISAEMKSIPLIAKARRIAIYYSQMAA